MNWVKQLFSRRREYHNLSDEIAEHLQEKVDELIASGMPRPDAEAAARRQFGNALLLEEHGREVWQWALFDAVLRDLKYAFRQLRHNPGFTFTVLLTLGLGIGANTAVFSMVNALLLRPLPYPQPERLGSLISHYDSVSRSTGKVTSEDDNSSDGETWELVRDNVPAVIAGATAGTRGVNLQIGSSIRNVREQRVSARYLDALGVKPIFGRSFTEEEDRPNGAKAVVVRYEIWQSLLGSDPDAIGKTIRLKGEPYTVVGVLPPHTETPDKADLLTPLRPTRTGEGEGNNYGVILRLRDGATWAQADAQLTPLRPENLVNFQSRQPKGHAWLYAVPLQQDIAREGTPVYLLMSAVALVLLIAAANLAGLMVVRVLRRRGEIATRLALGATPASVLRQLMTEPLVLALVGGSIGIAMAANVLGLLARLAPADTIPVGGLGLDHRVLWFAVAISLFCSLFIGILPALELRRMDLRSSMTASASRSSPAAGRSRMRQALIAGEVMLTVVLLAGAGLLIRTLVYLETLPSGFDANNVLTAKVSLDDARYHDPVAFHKLLQQSVDAMKRIPGVESAAVGLSLPYERGLNNGVVILDGPSAGKAYTSSDAYVTPEYFQSMRIPILSGRGFAESDSASSETVALVNFTFARKLLGSNDPVGRHIRSNGVTYTIVGMVADVTKRPGIMQTAPLATEAVFYVPATQMSQAMVNIAHVWFQPSWIVRTNGPVAGLSEAMQKALSDCDPSLPFVGFHSLSDIQALALQQQRFEVLLLGILAGMALLLSLVGVYGLVSNMVAQRTREIGIRMALGSSVRQAMMEVGASGIAAVGFGIAAGLALAAVAVRIIKSELYGVKIYDPVTFVVVLLLLMLAAAAATYLPTRRIAYIDPASTLRAE